MPYKIVATQSRRGLEITLCPSAWEEDGVLSWPPTMVSRLQKDSESYPEPHWTKYKCEPKKRGIGTYEEALEWEKAFQNADTDAESDLVIRQPRQILKEMENHNNNFDSMFDSIKNNPVMVLDLNARSSTVNLPDAVNTLSPARFPKTNIVPNQETPMLSNFSPSFSHYLPKSKAPSPCIIDLPVLQVDSDCQAEILKKIDALQTNVNDVKVSLASLQQQQNINTIKIMTMLDNMSKHFQKGPEMRELAGSAPDDDHILIKYTLPLDNLTNLKDLDRDLSQEKHFTSMVKHFSSLVGADGQGRGDILGKKMAEQIMTRDLMTKMSWTGVSRTAEFQRKFAFQTLENVVKLFYNVVLKADSRWSYDKNEKLFSGTLLKHAKKRAIAEKEKAEKKKKMFKEGDNLTRVDNDTAAPSNISATEEKPATPSEISAPEARESFVDEDTK